MSKTTSRRTILAGIAAAPVLGVPAVASELTPDPIFDAIERSRAVTKAYVAHMHQEPPGFGAEYKAWDTENGERCHDSAGGRWDVCRTVPTTKAGALALIAFMNEWAKDWGDDWEMVSGMVAYDDDGNPTDANVFATMLASLGAFLAVQS